MRVVAVEEFLRDLATHIVDEGELIPLHEPPAAKVRSRLLSEGLSEVPINVDSLVEAAPDCILASLPEPELLPRIREELFTLFGRQIFVHHHRPVRLEEVYTMMIEIGRQVKHPDKGKALANRIKSQVMDWCSNFYDRIKNKRVTFISSIDPLLLGGRWIPDMIRAASGTSQALLAQEHDQLIRWQEVVQFNPDILIVALKDRSFAEGIKTFPQFSKFPHWDEIYAVKRGDVYFTDGQSYFHQPTTKLIESMGILVSAMAGFDSGYITPRDSMYKLRFLELHRHRFI